MTNVPKGKCNYCNKTFAKSGMWKHLETCKERKSVLEKITSAGEGTKCFHILVNTKIYWMHIEIPVSATLKDLDGFLRDTWVECCGHLSLFSINDVDYISDPDSGDKGMKCKLSSVLKYEEFFYEYDFGSTTRLKLRVLSEYEGEMKGKSVKILARNEAPKIICRQCEKKVAEEICCFCGPLCKTCLKEDECGELTLPIVNSPRTGVCGYVG